VLNFVLPFEQCCQTARQARFQIVVDQKLHAAFAVMSCAS
jgi:hypothetical protein